MKFSMNGFRRQLSSDLDDLKNLIAAIVNEEDFDKDDLVDCLNEVIAKSNALNCVYTEGDEHFTDIGHIEIDLLENP